MGKYSVLSSVYINTKASELILALDSIEMQSVPPEQIVIVLDGPVLGDVELIIKDKKEKKSELYTIVYSEKNIGLGRALALGMNHCRNEIIARADTDDICLKERCAKQLNLLEKNKEISAVGSNILEFVGDIKNTVGSRVCPEFNDEIIRYMKKRCPINHMSVMFKKTDVLKAGGYQDWFLNEDSFLWVRMHLNGCKFYNIQENLVYARVGKDMYARRGGYKYFKSEKKLFKYMYRNNVINYFEYIIAVSIRFVVQVLMTNTIRQWFFKTFAREKIREDA